MDNSQRLAADRQLIEGRLQALVALPQAQAQRAVVQAMAYSLLGGGKRVRGVLTLAFCRLFCGEEAPALEAACAVEMVHAYSLIHDDLPCMDDDDLRRGKPSCHKAFGEAIALLAGDGLLNLAFETALSPAQQLLLGAQRTLEVARCLAGAAGVMGMIGGQVMDLAGEGRQLSAAQLEQMDRHKTGALIRAAVEMGCLCGGADPAQRQLAGEYAGAVGLAFQVVDDILDVEGDPALLGKNTGSDQRGNKSTYVSALSLPRARQLAQEQFALAGRALEQLRVGPEDFLAYFTGVLARRQS